MEDLSLLRQALPYIKLYRNKIFVIKFGGEVVSDQDRMDALAADLSLLHELNIRIVSSSTGEGRRRRSSPKSSASSPRRSKAAA